MKFLTSPRSLGVVVLVCALGAQSARAQEPRRLARPDSIPIELATALIAAGGLGGEPQILIGSVPGWVSDRVAMPDGAVVRGSAFIGNTVVGIVDVSGDPEQAMSDFRGNQEKRGWKVPPPTTMYMGGGFRPANAAPVSASAPTTRVTLCGGDHQMLIASTARRTGGRTELTMRVAPLPTYSVCSPPPRTGTSMRAPFPTLYHPADASDSRLNSACFANGASSGTGEQIHTTLSSDALLAHYGKQLVDSGWRAPTGGGIVGATWTRVDSAGAPIEVSLTITPSARDAQCKSLSLNVRTPGSP